MPEENNKTNLSEEESEEPASTLQEEAVIAEEQSAVPIVEEEPKIEPVEEIPATEPSSVPQSGNTTDPTTQAAPVNGASKPEKPPLQDTKAGQAQPQDTTVEQATESTIPSEQPAPVQPVPTQDAGTVQAEPSFLEKLKEQLGFANEKRRQKVKQNLDKVMEYAKEKQKITNDEVERITGVKDRQALKYLKILVKQGKLVRFGKKRNTFYKPAVK